MFEDIKFNEEPLTKDVEKVLKFDQKLMLSVIDVGKLTEEEKKKDITEVITNKLIENPEKMSEYLTKQKMATPIKTVMLVTGLTEREIQGMPIRPLYKKCVEVLGGNVDDFFRELGIDTSPKMML